MVIVHRHAPNYRGGEIDCPFRKLSSVPNPQRHSFILVGWLLVGWVVGWLVGWLIGIPGSWMIITNIIIIQCNHHSTEGCVIPSP